MKLKEQNLNEAENPQLNIGAVISSNLVDGKLDAVGVLTDIFNEECAKAVIKSAIQRIDLINFLNWVNEDKKLGYTSIGLKRIVDRYLRV